MCRHTYTQTADELSDIMPCQRDVTKSQHPSWLQEPFEATIVNAHSAEQDTNNSRLDGWCV